MWEECRRRVKERWGGRGVGCDERSVFTMEKTTSAEDVYRTCTM